ncbi:hypothetical protein AQUCO_01700198v1 [Aquilegia coerulea]|uniref:Uncharacterized protein n=1 Tax=Aquilegia coerulea TaxID=218851 RepID=A0A2G5DLP2_AQUCA|nr:hypothetical protein AQUCO_01700198v1 [Aquilegia coerulea]
MSSSSSLLQQQQLHPPLHCFGSRRLSSLQQHLHHLKLSSKLSSRPNCFCSSSANHYATTIAKSSIKPFSSVSVSETQNSIDETSKEEELAESENDDWTYYYLELDVTTTSCHRVNFDEWQNGPYVFKIIENPGDMKITLKGECDDDSESIQVVVHLPQDGNAYHERDMHLDVTIVDNADQSISEFHIRAYSGLHKLECFCKTTTHHMSEKASRFFLRARGIDMSLEIFLRDYLIKKYLRKDLIPNVEHGY